MNTKQHILTTNSDKQTRTRATQKAHTQQRKPIEQKRPHNKNNSQKNNNKHKQSTNNAISMNIKQHLFTNNRDNKQEQEQHNTHTPAKTQHR